jgi:protein-histidine pros-kinase
VENRAVQVNVNVSSARLSGSNNFLDCGVFEDTVVVARSKLVHRVLALVLSAEERWAMGLRTKFNLALLAAMAVGIVVGAVVFRYTSIKDSRGQVVENARIMMAAASAIRKYTAQDLRPLLPLEHNGKFVPETVPAYAAQKNFKELQTDFKGFSYREPTLNPTNPSNRPQAWEADIVNLFRDDPSINEFVTERQTPTGSTLYLARPLKVQSEACLTCHGSPGAAPVALRQTYGLLNGFGWRLNETIGAQIVSASMETPLALAHKSFLAFLFLVVIIFGVVFLVLNLMLHFLVVAPIAKVTAIAEAVSLGDQDAEIYVKAGNDEIASLSASINRMREMLKV